KEFPVRAPGDPTARVPKYVTRRTTALGVPHRGHQQVLNLRVAVADAQETGGHPLPVGAPGHVRLAVRLVALGARGVDLRSFQDAQQAAGRRVPETDGVVRVDSGQAGAVLAPGECLDGADVATQVARIVGPPPTFGAGRMNVPE